MIRTTNPIQKNSDIYMKDTILTLCLLIGLTLFCADAVTAADEYYAEEIVPAVVKEPTTAIEVFTDSLVPDSVFALFSVRTRLDMADYHRYHLDNYVENKFGNKSRIVESTDKHIVVEVGRASSLTVVLLPIKGEPLLAVVETVMTPHPDSAVTFRRLSDWSVVPQKNAITMADFATDNTKTATEMPQMFFKQISYIDDEDVFLFTNTTDGYYVASDAPDGLGTLASSIKARFDGKKWKVVR